MNKKIVSIFTGAEGHLSLAQAAKQAYSDTEFKVYFNHMKTNMISLYRPIYRYVPSLNKIPFKMSQYDRTQKILDIYSKLSYQNQITRILAKQKPDIVISTHFYFNKILENINTHKSYEFITIVSDPRSISPVITTKTAHNIVFDESAKTACKNIGIPSKNISITGWLVRKEFEQPYNMISVRKSLNLPIDQINILVTGGSEGTNHILKILPAILNLSQPATIVVACGSNKNLFNAVRTLSKISSSTYKSGPTLIPLKFTNNIYKYMQSADLIIGKAGPNILFESVATITPFLAITHVSGQEDGNIDIIRDYQIGIVEENTLKLPKVLKDIIDSPQSLSNYNTPLTKLALHNKLSKEKLLSMSRKLTNQSRT